MSNYKKIEAFHDDNKTRVIWWYGPVIKNNSASNTPEVLILTRLFAEDNTLTDNIQTFLIPVTELALVRIGTIWKGRERTDDSYRDVDNYKTDREYSFDFRLAEPVSIKYTDKNPNTGFKYIRGTAYELGDLGSNKQIIYQFLNSTLTKLISKKGITVLIPSLELLTNAISPELSLMRAKLLQSPLDKIWPTYIHRGHQDDAGVYTVESKAGFFTSNLTLLAYMRLDKTSRSRLSSIWTSMEGNQSKYPDRYPIILPYHPTGLMLQGDGIQIDDKTFLMLRINGFSLPTDHPVYNIVDEYDSNTSQASHGEHERKIPHANNVLQKNNLPITGDNDPHHEAGELYVKTEVKIIGPRPEIKMFKKSKNNNEPPIFIAADQQEITALSSGEQNSRNESKGIASLKQAPIKPEENNIARTLKELQALVKDPKSIVQRFSYIGNDGSENTKETYCYVTESAFQKGHKRKWYIKDKSKLKTTEPLKRYRNFLIVKIVLKDWKTGYLLETEQKGTEAFSGLLFNIDGKFISQIIKDLLLAISNNEGKFRQREKVKAGEKSKLIPIQLPVSKSLVFDHRDNWHLSRHIDDDTGKDVFS